MAVRVLHTLHPLKLGHLGVEKSVQVGFVGQLSTGFVLTPSIVKSCPDSEEEVDGQGNN